MRPGDLASLVGAWGALGSLNPDGLLPRMGETKPKRRPRKVRAKRKAARKARRINRRKR